MTDSLQAIHQEFETTDKRCLHMFAESIREAHRCGGNKWGVTRYNDRARLIVGGVVVCSLHEDGIWFALDKDHATSADYVLVNDSGDWQQTGPNGLKVPSIGGIYRPSQQHAKVWPSIRRMHFALIHSAATKYKQLRKHCQKAHLKEFMQYLREATNLADLPDPVY